MSFGSFFLQLSAENSCIFTDLWYNKQKYAVNPAILGGNLMAENKQYILQSMENGSVLISEDVIATIVSNAVAEVEGVAGLSVKPGADIVDMIGKKGWGKGLKITIDENDALSVDCNVNVNYGQSVVTVAKAVQEAVVSALDSVAGIKAAAINVNVCGIIRQ